LYQIKGLVKQYGRPAHTVLDDIHLTIPSGSVFGLLGPNGAGKTTLLSILVGLISKTAGRIEFDGLDLDDCLDKVRANVGFVPQDLAFYPMLTGRENLEFFAGVLNGDGQRSPAYKKKQLDFCIQVTGLEKHIDKKAQNYSGGLKRRLNLAIGLLNQPKLLCLDEPTVGIDPHSRNFILQTISELNQQGMTIIYTSHYMEEVEQICNRVAIIDHGKILVEGKTGELLSDGEAEITVHFNQPLPKDNVSALKQFDITRMDNNWVSIKTQQPVEVINRIAALLGGSGLQIKRIHYGYKNLEELFLALTDKQLRDTVDE
jgi:ABC-2 type transport system ATP-binding protein